jgi:hypothetical protein
MPVELGPPRPSATERVIKGSPLHTTGAEFEFFEWVYTELGIPWRDRPEDLSGLFDEGWEVISGSTTPGRMVMARMIPIPEEPEPEHHEVYFPLAVLPDDLADAFEQMKLALMRHRAENWLNIGLEDACDMLACLMQLARGAEVKDHP